MLLPFSCTWGGGGPVRGDPDPRYSTGFIRERGPDVFGLKNRDSFFFVPPFFLLIIFYGGKMETNIRTDRRDHGTVMNSSPGFNKGQSEAHLVSPLVHLSPVPSPGVFFGSKS